MKIEKLVDTASAIPDPRRQHGNKRHKPADIVAIGLCTILCKGEGFTDMEDFGNGREEWLRAFLELPSGIPDSDTFRRVSGRTNPAELSAALYGWLGAEREKRGVIAVDGKTICGSKNAARKACHVVSAFASENQLTLGGLAAGEKATKSRQCRSYWIWLT
jgi:hypothetical protein